MRKKLVRYLSGAVCLLIAAGIALSVKMPPVKAATGEEQGTISYKPKDASAELGTEENPFTVLEIVPNKSMGMIGYMIPGCEPVDMEAFKGDPKFSYSNALVDAKIFSTEGKCYKYAFKNDLPENAVICDSPYSFDEMCGKWTEYKNEQKPGYSEYGYYENVGEGNGKFSLTSSSAAPVFGYKEGGAYNWVRVGYYYPVENGKGTHNRTGNAATGYAFVETQNGNFCYQMETEYAAGDVTQDLTARYWTLRTDEIYYSYLYNGYHNEDVFIQGSFEGASSYEGFVSQVLTVTPDQLTGKNLEVIDAADLIVMTAQNYGVEYWKAHNRNGETLTEQEQNTTTFSGASGNDLPWEAVEAIMNKMASKNPAAMMLEAPQMTGSGNYNVEKLYIMLMQYGAKPFKAAFMDDEKNFRVQEVTVDGKTFLTGAYRNEDKGETEFATTWNMKTFETSWGISVMHQSEEYQGSSGEVFGNVLTYNGDTTMLWGFITAPIAEIKDTGNEWYKKGSNSELFDYYYEKTGTRPPSLTMQNGAHYILQNGNVSQGYKNKLHVLEVQPCNQFIHGSFGWELYYANLFPWFTGDFTEDLTVTTMTTYQLIGDITDLNSEYDLILFGSKQDVSNGLYGYNDSNMQKIIYTGLGDLVEPRRNYPWTYNLWAISSKGSDANQLGARYSGNDLTKKKYEELCDYLKSGSPIIVSKDLYNYENKINKNKVDESSYMYSFGNLIYKENVNHNMLFKEGSYKDSAGYDLLKAALAKEKCAMDFAKDENGNVTGYPTVYAISTTDGTTQIKNSDGNGKKEIPVTGLLQEEQYNEQRDEAGNPLLRFEFTLLGNPASTYGVRLYIDRNGDGIYANSIKERNELFAAGKTPEKKNDEEVDGATLRITDVTGAPEAVTNQMLLAGHRYVIERSVPAGERGILPWKLEVYDNTPEKSNDSIRCSEMNYTAIKPSVEERVEIHVLQMNPTPDMSKPDDTYVNFADQSTETGAKFAAYLNAVKDFDVKLSYMKNEKWYQEFGQGGTYAKRTNASKEDLIQRWEEYLEDVDMLIIGFRDIQSFTNDEIFYEGFKDFVNSGKSVILSHDLVKDATFYYRNNEYVTGYDDEIRTLAGQRRKYYVTNSGDTNDKNRNYYRYNSASLMGSGVNLVPNVDMRWGLNSISHIYNSTVPTNIPEDSSGLTVSKDTYEAGEKKFYMDKASAFMDNSVRLLATYASDNEKLDRDFGEKLGSNSISDNWPKPAITEWVHIANTGQVTNYPYTLGDTIRVSPTHVQNFQVDLEQEDGGDVTVWYNLTDERDKAVREQGDNKGLYSSRPGDSRNNYYLYTKGNITYTGLGHNKDYGNNNIPLTDDEVKLFVNTMVASYRVVPGKPYIKVTNEETALNENVYTMYVMLTGEEKDQEVDFTVVEESLTGIEGRKYYLQYRNEEGEIITPTTFVAKSDAQLELPKGENRYEVSANGKYYFKVPYGEIAANGEKEYELTLTTVDTGDVEMQKSVKVVIYAMPLFPLN